MRPWVMVVLLVVAAPAVAADDLTVPKADGDTPPQRMLRAYLLAEAQKAFDARRAAVAALKTPVDVQKRQKELRAKFVEALGGFPDKTPLGARAVGTDQRDGYRIRKLVFETEPGVKVPGLFFDGGRGPLVIYADGAGKAADDAYRAVGAAYAKAGAEKQLVIAAEQRGGSP